MNGPGLGIKQADLRKIPPRGVDPDHSDVHLTRSFPSSDEAGNISEVYFYGNMRCLMLAWNLTETPMFGSTNVLRKP